MTFQYPMFSQFLNISYIRAAFEYLVEQFIEGLDHPHSSRQDLCALSISWLCTFVPEAVSPALIEKLEATLRRETDGTWDLFIPPRTAIYAVTNEVSWMNLVYHQVDHRTSRMRVIVLESLAVVAPLLNFYRRDFMRAILHNLESNQLYALESFFLSAAWTDVSEERKEFLTRARNAQQSNGWSTKTLDALLEGRSVLNTHYCDMFSRIARFIAVSGWTAAVTIGPGNTNEMLALTVTDLLGRIENHPLTGPFVTLKNLDFDETNTD